MDYRERDVCSVLDEQGPLAGSDIWTNYATFLLTF
jgi:hypothetical protein